MKIFNRGVAITVILTLCITLSGCVFLTAKEQNGPTSQKDDPSAGKGTLSDSPSSEDTTLRSYVEVMREGEVSRIPVDIVKGTVADYTVAVDPEYFTYSSHETVDCFDYTDWYDSGGVYYRISDYYADSEDFADGVLFQYEKDYNSCSVQDTTIGKYNATAVYLHGDKTDPDYNMHIFLVEYDSGALIIETRFVTEMYEGLYVIIRACLDTIEIKG